jgi:branched-chain amino acid transport system permease protein
VKIINFAQGALLTVGVYLVYWLSVLTGLDPYATLPAVVLLLAGLGYLIQVGIINRVLRQERVSQLLITFGLAMFFENGLLALFGANHRSVTTFLGSSTLVFGSVRVSATSAVAFGGAAVAIAALWLFLAHTRLGTAIRSVAQQPDSAALAGINVRHVYAVAFAVGTGMVGLAAVLMAPIYDVEPKVGNVFGVIAFIVVVLGGLGSVFGAALAGLILGLAQNLFATYVSPQLSVAFLFVVFIAILLVRPTGLFGRSFRMS